MRVLLVSDLHANPDALAVLPNADATICGGDLVDYGPDPKASIAWCRERGATVVTGNHDFAISHQADCGVKGRMRQASVESRAAHLKLLSADELDFLRNLPRVAIISTGGTTFAVTHSTPGDVYPYLPLAEAGSILAMRVPLAQTLILGHTHAQDRLMGDGTTIVNPGSVGLASTGGTVHYAIWQDGVVTLHAEPYDVDAAITKLRRLDLQSDTFDLLVRALRTGRTRN